MRSNSNQVARIAKSRAREPRWEHLARDLIKLEMQERELTFKQLRQRLGPLPEDADELEHQVKLLTQKVRRGTFSLAFALEVLIALGVRAPDLGYVYQRLGRPLPAWPEEP